MRKIAIVGSRYMSRYGKGAIDQLRIKNSEVVTIKVSGCNNEVIKKCKAESIKVKIFEGNDFEKLNEQVASYADLLVIIEGSKNSGTILLADKFVEKNKLIYCVPGRITDENSWACNWLIQQGAITLIDFDQF